MKTSLWTLTVDIAPLLQLLGIAAPSACRTALKGIQIRCRGQMHWRLRWWLKYLWNSNDVALRKREHRRNVMQQLEWRFSSEMDNFWFPKSLQVRPFKPHSLLWAICVPFCWVKAFGMKFQIYKFAISALWIYQKYIVYIKYCSSTSHVRGHFWPIETQGNDTDSSLFTLWNDGIWVI